MITAILRWVVITLVILGSPLFFVKAQFHYSNAISPALNSLTANFKIPIFFTIQVGIAITITATIAFIIGYLAMKLARIAVVIFIIVSQCVHIFVLLQFAKVDTLFAYVTLTQFLIVACFAPYFAKLGCRLAERRESKSALKQ